jgi:hypothetical protein
MPQIKRRIPPGMSQKVFEEITSRLADVLLDAVTRDREARGGCSPHGECTETEQNDVNSTASGDQTPRRKKKIVNKEEHA